MKDKLEKVKEFHDVFGIKNSDHPTLIDKDKYILRTRLMSEETIEYFDACEDGDLVEIADALGDQLYVLLGTMLVHGMQDKIDEIFDEIHRSNISKLGPGGKILRDPDGKVKKSELYIPPNIKSIITNPFSHEEDSVFLDNIKQDEYENDRTPD